MTASTLLSDSLLSLSEQPQFKDCERRHIVTMLAHTELVELAQGETVCKPEQPADCLWFLVDGNVSYKALSGENWQQQQGFIGEEAALDLGHYHNTAVTEQHCWLLRIPAHAVAKPEQHDSDPRVSMVAQSSDYVWSSYQINALGKVSNLCSPHCLYAALGINDTERQATYQRLFTSHVEGELLEKIRAATKSGMALGNDRFKSELTSLTGRRLHTLPPGRKLGWRKC